MSTQKAYIVIKNKFGFSSWFKICECLFFDRFDFNDKMLFIFIDRIVL